MLTGSNHGLDAILAQIKTPHLYTATIFRHQIAKEICLRYLRMRSYMDKHFADLKINLSNYVLAIYSGAIWLDELILCIIALMFRVSISIISPYYTAMRNLLHNLPSPDIVIIVNGSSFHQGNIITQVTATRHKDQNIGIVGSNYEIPKVLVWGGVKNGEIAAQHEIH